MDAVHGNGTADRIHAEGGQMMEECPRGRREVDDGRGYPAVVALRARLSFGLVAAGVVLAVRPRKQVPDGLALRILEQRYAAGEIDRAEFDGRRGVLLT